MKIEIHAKKAELNRTSHGEWWLEVTDEASGISLVVWFEKLAGRVPVDLSELG